MPIVIHPNFGIWFEARRLRDKIKKVDELYGLRPIWPNMDGLKAL